MVALYVHESVLVPVTSQCVTVSYVADCSLHLTECIVNICTVVKHHKCACIIHVSECYIHSHYYPARMRKRG